MRETYLDIVPAASLVLNRERQVLAEIKVLRVQLRASEAVAIGRQNGNDLFRLDMIPDHMVVRRRLSEALKESRLLRRQSYASNQASDLKRGK